MPRTTVALALTALVISGAALGIFTPVHAASDGALRIEDGPSDNEGRLEIFHDGKWGAVCDDFFASRDAGVACEQLGYTGGRSLRGKWPAPGDMPIWLDDVGCTGSESRLDLCPHPGWGQHNCAAREAVGVRCSGTLQIPEPPPDPKPATGLSASGATTTTVGLSWALPTQPGSVTVTRVEVQQQSGTTWSTVTRLGASATTHTVTGLTAGTTYSFRIRLATNSGNADSGAVAVTTQGAAPIPAAGLTASNATATSVDLSWTLPWQPSGITVTGVKVQQQAADESWSTVETLGATATSHTVTGLTASTSYSFRIEIATSRGNAMSDAVSADTLVAPNPATDLTASNATPTSVDLSWTLPEQPDGVTVSWVVVLQQAADDSGTKITPLAADATTHTVTGLTAGTSYSFRIRLATSSGDADSDAVSADTLVAPNPATGLTASNVTYTTVDLSWTLPEQPEGVTVSAVEVLQLHPGPDVTVVALAAGATSYKVTELAAGTDHFFRIRLVTNRGTALTLAVSATTLAGPNPPTDLTASNETETTVDLAWTLPAHPDGVTVTGVEVRQKKANPYVVDEHLTRPTTTVATLAADATSYTVRGLTEVRRYTYRIRLITNGQGHADSQPVTISKIPNPRPPTGLAASNATSSTVDLSWTLPEQPEGVSVRGIRVWQEVDQEPEPRPSSSHSPTAFDFPHTAWLSSTMLGADTTSHTVTGLTPETEYRFKISLDLDIDGATNVDGGGPANRWSKPVGVTTLAAANPATGLTASNPTQTTVDLAWTLPTQPEGVTVTGVEVQQQAVDQSWVTAAMLAADATSYTVTGLTAGTSYKFRVRLATSSGNADSEPAEAQTAHMPLEVKMAGSVPSAQDPGSSPSRSRGDGPGGCAVEVSVEFLDAAGDPVAVDALAVSDFTVATGSLGTPVADDDGLGWTVPAWATVGFTGLMRVRLPATERWEAAEQVFRVASDADCAPVARTALADLRLEGMALEPAFDSDIYRYRVVVPNGVDSATLDAEAVYGRRRCRSAVPTRRRTSTGTRWRCPTHSRSRSG